MLSVPKSDLTDVRPSEWFEFAIGLYHAKPSMAPVFNISNSILLMVENEDLSQ